MQDRRRHPEQRRPPQRRTERTRELGVGDRRRRGRVHRSGQRRRRDNVGDQAHQVVALDPRHPLPAAADRAAEAEFERDEELAEHPALGAEHQADAQPHHPHAQALRLPRFALPGFAEAMREATLAAVELGERLVLPQPVPADGGAADQHRRSLLQPRDQTNDGTRHAQPRRQDLAPLAPRPQAVAGRLARKIDHGIDPRVVRDLREVRHDAQRWPQRRRLGRVAGEHGDVVAGARERVDQAAPDEAGGAGDEHMLAGRQRVDQHRRIARVRAAAAEADARS